MSLEHTPDGGVAEGMDELHHQPQFVGYLALVLLACAVLFGIVCLVAASTHAPVVF